MYYFRFAVLVSFFCFPFVLQGQIAINEVMASNKLTIADEDGEFSDWVELVNISGEAVNLSGYHLSDKTSDPGRWTFPPIILESGEYLLVFASGKNRFSGELHTDFKIKAAGESIVFSDPDEKQVDIFPSTPLGEDESMGRIPDGSGPFIQIDLPSPGEPNVPPFTDEVEFSLLPGFYSEEQTLVLESATNSNEIYYTLNGDIPDTNSFRYTEPLALVHSANLSINPIVDIPTNPPGTPEWFKWKSPTGNPFRGHVVRAAVFKEGKRISSVETKSYFLSPDIQNRFDLDVISIVTEEDNLFGHERGLFVPGKTFEDNPSLGAPWPNGNYRNRGREWEREADLFFFNSTGELEFQQQLGLRVHGGGSRSLPAKSIRLYAREAYGDPFISFPLFDGDTLRQFKRLILRNSGQDMLFSMFRDALAVKIIDGLPIEKQAYRPSVLFINGAYYGIINIRERMDKYYFEQRFGTREADLNILEFGGFEIDEGRNDNYLEFLNRLRGLDADDPQALSIIRSYVDLDNFIDYYIAKMFFAVFDWPGNNIKFWKEQDENSRWRWLFYDNDDGFEPVDFDPYAHLTDMSDNSWPNPLWSTELFRTFIEIEEFRELFLDRISSQLCEVYNSNRTIDIAEQIVESIKSEMPEHIDRWRYPSSMEVWYDNTETIMRFLRERPEWLLEKSLEFFEIPEEKWNEYQCPEEPEIKELVVYPNPSSGEFTFLLPDGNFIKKIDVFDLHGKNMHTFEFSSTDDNDQFQIDLGHLMPGTFIYQIQMLNGAESKGKLVLLPGQ